MIDLFCAISLNNKICCLEDKNIFTKSSSQSLLEFRNEFRNMYQYLLVGANTIKNDNPLLLNEEMNNKRIIIDKYADLNLESKVFNIKPEQTIIFLMKNNKKYIKELKMRKVMVIQCNKHNLLTKLKKHLKGNVMIEGGSKIINFFLDNKMINDLNLVVFPFILPISSLDIFQRKIIENLILLEYNCIDNKYLYLKYHIRNEDGL